MHSGFIQISTWLLSPSILTWLLLFSCWITRRARWQEVGGCLWTRRASWSLYTNHKACHGNYPIELNHISVMSLVITNLPLRKNCPSGVVNLLSVLVIGSSVCRGLLLVIHLVKGHSIGGGSQVRHKGEMSSFSLSMDFAVHTAWSTLPVNCGYLCEMWCAWNHVCLQTHERNLHCTGTH